MKLSIIICVYNTAVDYLTECLDSITRSTVKDLAGDYEICMVDDGSSLDYTPLVAKYGIRYVKTENRGILSARRTGIEMASGEYAVFCDSDDTVSHNYYLPMVERAEECGADIVINDWALCTPRMKYCYSNDETIKYDFCFSGDDTLRAFMKNEGRQHSFYVLWNKVYSTALLREAFEALRDAGYPDDVSYAEDAAINFFAWKQAKMVVNIHTGFYLYRIHKTQTVNAATPEKLLSQMRDISACFAVMRDNIGDNTYKEEILKNIREWNCFAARAHYATAKSGGYDELFENIKELYGVEKLSLPIIRDSADYVNKTLLGKNFSEVDELLLSIWDSEDIPNIKYDKGDKYTARCVKQLVKSGKARCDKTLPPDITIPSLECPLKLKIIHNGYVYKLGLIFFKKGSKMREFLKKFI